MMKESSATAISYIEPSIEKNLASAQYYEKWKRLFDIIGSIMGIIMCLPIFIIVAVLIKLEDPKGKILFSQVRVGLNGKEFKMYKFRSMVHDAEARLEKLLKQNEVQGAMFKMKDDPRITKVGKIIRKTSIDELPQFFNVFNGSMSLVGPRPPLVREVLEYTNYQKQRLLVKPGCTGLWQATVRNSVGFEEMVELDLTYIKKRSILLDFKILFMTVITLIKGNAY
jgi:lipopolysaccharide/colanic/teichoic acid biosynthesis glycosyltransferase